MADQTRISGRKAAQEYINTKTASTLFTTVPLLMVMGLQSGAIKKTADGIGLMDSTSILSGAKVPQVEQDRAAASDGIESLVHSYTQTDGKNMAMRDTLPVVANASSGKSMGERRKRIRGQWVQRVDTGEIFQNDLDRAAAFYAGAGEEKMASAKNQLALDSIDETTAAHAAAIATDLWNGTPTNIDAEMWDSPLGLVKQIGTDDNISLGLDRTVAANAFWKPWVYGTTVAADLDEIFAALKYKVCGGSSGLLKKNGMRTNLILCSGIFEDLERQAKARQLILEKGQSPFAELGYTGTVLKYENTYLMYDSECPTNKLYALDTTSLRLYTRKDKKFAYDGMHAQRVVKGGNDSQLYYIETQYALECRAPAWNAVLTIG